MVFFCLWLFCVHSSCFCLIKGILRYPPWAVCQYSENGSPGWISAPGCLHKQREILSANHFVSRCFAGRCQLAELWRHRNTKIVVDDLVDPTKRRHSSAKNNYLGPDIATTDFLSSVIRVKAGVQKSAPRARPDHHSQNMVGPASMPTSIFQHRTKTGCHCLFFFITSKSVPRRSPSGSSMGLVPWA